MAARTIRVRHQDDIRNKIRASQIVNRLENHVFGDVELTSTQVSAALGLLKKIVPDLAATELTGDLKVGLTQLIENLPVVERK